MNKLIIYMGAILFMLASLFGVQASEKHKKIDGKVLFKTKCAMCHTVGKGKRIGPDLKGVTKRRKHAWIKKMIKNPAEMLKSDPIAKKLLKEHNNVPMMSMGLNDAEIEAVIQYLKTAK